MISHAAQMIINTLEHISEDLYCAGWLAGIEHSIWSKLLGDSLANNIIYNDILELRKLAAECKGWVRWDDSKESNNVIYIPMDEWLSFHKEYTGQVMTDDQRQCFEQFMAAPEIAAAELRAKSDRLLNCGARAVLAIQASGRFSVHDDLISILEMIPVEIRRCYECGSNPGEDHLSTCNRKCLSFK